MLVPNLVTMLKGCTRAQFGANLAAGVIFAGQVYDLLGLGMS